MPRTESRWYYNSITGVCQQFTWLAISIVPGGEPVANSNNFQTQEQCMSYCAFNCRRGLPLYNEDPKASFFYLQKARTCVIGQCDVDHECQTLLTKPRCCPLTSKMLPTCNSKFPNFQASFVHHVGDSKMVQIPHHQIVGSRMQGITP